MIDRTVARYVIRQNMLLIWKLIGMVTFKELSKAYIKFEWKKFLIVSMIFFFFFVRATCSIFMKLIEKKHCSIKKKKCNFNVKVIII